MLHSTPKRSKQLAELPPRFQGYGHPTSQAWQPRSRRKFQPFDLKQSAIAPTARAEDLLISHLDEDQPSIVPATITLWIIADLPLCIVKTLTTERVIPSQATEFIEKIVRSDIICPSAGHRFLERELVFLGGYCCNSFNTAKLCERIDTMGVQGLDKLVCTLLW